MVVIVATKILNNNLSTPSSISPEGELLTPAVVAKDFKWVGESRNPYSISKPVYKYDSEGNFVGFREFKDKF